MTVTSPQDATLAAIYAHHRQLAAAVIGGATQVHDAAERLVDAGPYRDDLVRLMREDVLPHAAAEERTLYAAGADAPRTALLVQGMTDDHRRLEQLVIDLAAARSPMSMVALAAGLRTLFDAHLAKENDVLLPALVTDGVDLGALLEGMHEILGAVHSAEGVAAEGGCGCGGCGCGGEMDKGDAVLSSDLDVRRIPHAARHEQIFAAVDRLVPGEGFVIVNDHDPKPLRSQLDARSPGQVSWDYLAEGPQIWRVRIGRIAVG